MKILIIGAGEKLGWTPVRSSIVAYLMGQSAVQG
jgi:hypothetical protein